MTQTLSANEVCNFETSKKLVAEDPTPLLVPQQQFRSNRQHEMFTKDIIKQLKITSNKRRIVGNMTLPYGYVGPLDPVDETDNEMDVEAFAQMMVEATQDNEI